MIDEAVKVAGTLRVPSAAYPISCNNASLMIRQIRPKADGTWKVPATVAGTRRVPSAIYPINRNDSSLMIRRFQCRADGTWKVPATFQNEDIEADRPLFAGYHTIIGRPIKEVRPLFIAYQLHSPEVRSQIQSKVKGIKVFSVSKAILKSVKCWLPSASEQKAISSFLDIETSKIDGLVSEQRRLIELLKEKRQAVISHAVTKGLNPNAPMKPSGIQWLGDVPEHWSVASVGQRYAIRVGKMLDSAKITGTHLRPYLRVADVQWGEINTADLPEMDFDEDAQGKFRLTVGDLLVNEGGSYVGRSAIWRGELAECYYQKALHRLRPIDHEQDLSEFFFFVMLFATKFGIFVAGGNHNTIEHLPAESLRKYRFAFPEIDEQIEIAKYLTERTDRFGSLIAEAERAIELLQERRTALISAAVTGKIDVREFVQRDAL